MGDNLSPLQGSNHCCRYPGLTPRALFCRRSAAEHQDRLRLDVGREQGATISSLTAAQQPFELRRATTRSSREMSTTIETAKHTQQRCVTKPAKQ